MIICNSWQAQFKTWISGELVIPLIDVQTRNQELFRAGELIRNQGPSINVLSTAHERKVLQGKKMTFFSWKLLKPHLQSEIEPKMDTVTVFFPKLGNFFPIFEIGQGRPPPDTPSSYSMLLDNRFSLIRFKITKNLKARLIFKVWDRPSDGFFAWKPSKTLLRGTKNNLRKLIVWCKIWR